jgi:Uma2 family endonuclease
MSVGTFSTFPSFLPAPVPGGPPGRDGPRFRKWSVDEYHRMIEAGILKESEPVELLEGWISYLVPRGAPAPELRRWTVDEYYRLLDIGVLGEDERVELLEGWIVQQMPRNSPHETAVQKAGKRFRAILPAGWDVREQKVVSLSDSQPEPDCAVVAGDEDSYTGSHPTPAAIAIALEVSDSTLSVDRNWMGRIYGRAAIPVYWIVNIPDRQVEVYTDPTGPTDPPESAGYRNRKDYREADAVPVVIRGQEVARIPVAGLLPRA